MQIGAMIGNMVAHNPRLGTLTSDQRTKLNDILSRYDAGSFNQQSFNQLSGELRAAGIRPNAQVKSALEAKGIQVDAYVGKTQAPPAGGQPPGGPGGAPPPKQDSDGDSDSDTESTSSTSKTLTELLAEYLDSSSSSTTSAGSSGAVFYSASATTLRATTQAATSGQLLDVTA